MFMIRALDDIDKNTTRRQIKLKQASRAARELIKNVSSVEGEGETRAFGTLTPYKDQIQFNSTTKATEPEGVTNHGRWTKVANTLLEPLQIACESRTTKLVVTALDAIQKLLAHSYIQEGTKDAKTKGINGLLVSRAIQIVAKCFEYPDDLVQLYMLKALIIVVSNEACGAHIPDLNTAVKTCYNIYLGSRNSVNQRTAKTTLTQTLNHVFRRMDSILPEKRISAEEEAAELLRTSSDTSQTPQEALTEAKDIVAAVLEEIVEEGISASGDKSDEKSETVKENGTGEHKAEENGTTQPNEKGELDSGRSSNGSRSRTGSTGSTKKPRSRASSSGAQMVKPPLDKNDSIFNETDSEVSTKARTSSTEEIIYNDCAAIFRALCRLSVRDITGGNVNNTNSQLVQSKILSLELILSILENQGPVLERSEKFVNDLIKRYLWKSLLHNGVSSNRSVFKLSLSIFLTLLTHFERDLKHEVGVFFSTVLFRILESNNSTIQQKWLISQVLSKICKNPQLLVNIFLNYDCDLASPDIFERIVQALSKIAQGSGSVDAWNAGPRNITMNAKLKTLGLEALVAIMSSLKDWSSELYEDPNKSKEEDASIQDEPRKSVEVSDMLARAESTKLETQSRISLSGDMLYEQKQRKLIYERGREIFKLSSKKGMRYMVKEGLVKANADEIAQFLLNNAATLDKEQIGEYLGNEKEFNVSVLYAYVDSLDFTGMHIDLALRKFLARFRLPGEGQKIDRMMEKFAARFFEQNSEQVFENADAAYITSYATIMLATDLHSKMNKEKMTKPQFRRQLEGQNDSQNFPDDFIDSIYDRIAKEELKLMDNDVTSGTQVQQSILNEQQKLKAFQQEGALMVKRSQALVKEKMKKPSVYFTATNIAYVKPMFEIAWCPMLAAFSVVLEDTDVPRLIELCLEGFKAAIRVSSIFYLEIERNAFVSSLAKFTFLENVEHMQPKNIESIKVLINIAQTEGNYLGDSWKQVLRCTSQLDRLQHLSGPDVSEEISDKTPKNSESESRPSLGFFLRRSAPVTTDTAPRPRIMTLERMEIEEHNSIAVFEHIPESTIDYIFSSSRNLNNLAIHSFVECLCAASSDELSSNPPRLFSLQKLVEVAHYNMDRIRVVWGRIWKNFKDHFAKAGCHDNIKVAKYAVDNLRQLAEKFLEKEEMANFNFQKEFLRPFEFICTTERKEIREWVVHTLDRITNLRGPNIKSGWKSIFSVLSLCSSDSDPKVAELAYDLVDTIMAKYFHLVSDNFFTDLVNTLASFGKRSGELNNMSTVQEVVSTKAIKGLGFCAQQLASGKVLTLGDAGAGAKTLVFTSSPEDMKHWFPILTALYWCIVAHPHIDVRTQALEVLFEVLNKFGGMFNEDLWKLVFRGVLLPIFVDVNEDTVREEDEIAHWVLTTCLKALHKLVDLLATKFDQLSFLLSDILNLLVCCVLQGNETLATWGVRCLFTLVTNSSSKFTPDMWTLVCNCMKELYEKITPRRDVQALVSQETLDVLGGQMSPRGRRKAEKKDTPEPEKVPVEEPAKEPVADDKEKVVGDEASDEVGDAAKRRAPMTPPVTSKLALSDPHENINVKIRIQTVLIKITNDKIVSYQKLLSLDNLNVILNCLEDTFDFSRACTVNQNVHGSLNEVLLKLLLDQEISAKSCLLNLLFVLYKSAEDEDRVKLAEERLVSGLLTTISDFSRMILKETASPHEKRIQSDYVPLVCVALNGFEKFTDSQFDKHLSKFYPTFTDLILCKSIKIRNILRKVLQRAGQLRVCSKDAKDEENVN